MDKDKEQEKDPLDKLVEGKGKEGVMEELEKKYGSPVNENYSSLEEAARASGMLDGIEAESAKVNKAAEEANEQIKYLSKIDFNTRYSPVEKAVLWMAGQTDHYLAKLMEKDKAKNGGGLYRRTEKWARERVIDNIEEEVRDHLKSLEKVELGYDSLIKKLEENKEKHDTRWMGGKGILENEIYPQVTTHKEEIDGLKEDYQKAVEEGRADIADVIQQRITSEKDAFSQAMNNYNILESRVITSRNIAIAANNRINQMYLKREYYQTRLLDAKEALGNFQTTKELKSLELLPVEPIELEKIDQLTNDLTNYTNAQYCELNKAIQDTEQRKPKAAINILSGERGERSNEDRLLQRWKDIEQRHTEIRDLNRGYLKAVAASASP